MRCYVRYIAALDKKNNVHFVEFFEGINIVTGKSSTGKSALLQIFNYCFGSSHCPIPAGVITENVQLYFIVLVLGNSFLVLGRKAKTNKCFLIEETQCPDINHFKSEYFSNFHSFSLPEFKSHLAHYFGLLVTDTEENNESVLYRGKSKPSPSIRHLLSFMMLPQSIVANNQSLFYRFDDNRKKEQTIDQAKIFLGFVDQNYYLHKQHLNELKTELKRAQIQSDLLQRNKERLTRTIEVLIDDYEAITGKTNPLLKVDELLDSNSTEWLMALKQTVTEIEDSSDNYVQILKKYQSDRNSKIVEIRHLKNKLIEIDSSIEYANHFNTASKEKPESQTAKVFLSSCPFCHQTNEELLTSANELTEAITWLNEELRKTPYLIEPFSKEKRDIENQIQFCEGELQEINTQILQIKKMNSQIDVNHSLLDHATKILLRIETIIENYYSEVRSTPNVEQLKQDIKKLQDILETNYDVKKELLKANKYIDQQMNAFAKALPFEEYYCPINLHFDLNNFLLCHEDKLGNKVYLHSMGSAANALYCHLSLFMSLNRYFCKFEKRCCIPPILFMDQPSQVFFPSEKAQTELVPNDAKVLTEIFENLVDFVNGTKDMTTITPQIIIMEHADNLELKNADFDQLVNNRRWQKEGEGFIKIS